MQSKPAQAGLEPLPLSPQGDDARGLAEPVPRVQWHGRGSRMGFAH